MDVNKDMKTIPTTNVGNLLAGQFSGVNVSTPDGVPGTAPNISIRMPSSWNAQPVVYVIDGVVSTANDFNNLSANEIKSVTVLKDAASAALYGSRAAGGVLLVSTNKGYIGKPIVNYNFSTGFDSRTKNESLTNAVQTGELYDRINGSSDPAGWAWSQQELNFYKAVNNGWGYDQLNAVWRNPSTQQHNLSVTGGSEKVKYFFGASYIDQNGFMPSLAYKKFNLRGNMTINITDDLQMFVGLALTNSSQGNLVWESPSATYRKLLVWQPDQPVFTNTGKIVDYGWIANVGAASNGDAGYNKNNILTPEYNINATYKFPFLNGLSAKAAFSQNYSYNRQSIFNKNYTMYELSRSGADRHIIVPNDSTIIGTRQSSWVSNDFLQNNIAWSNYNQLDLQLNYDHSFGLHHVQAAFVYENSQSNGSNIYAYRQNFPVYETDQWWATSTASTDQQAGGGASISTGRASYIGQLNYDYNTKYLVNLSLRDDGSMNFAPNKRWGLFPAGSIGWVMSKEPFFKIKDIDNLKIRASIGVTGNDNVGGWQWQQSYQTGNSAYFGNPPTTFEGITYGGVVNPNLTWEKSLSYDFGFDATFYKYWNTSVDYYYVNTYDILGTRNGVLPTTFSLTMPSENYGQIHAQGIDFNLGYHNMIGEVRFSGNLNLSYGWNKVIKEDYAQNAQSIDIPVGKSTNYIVGYAVDEIIRTQAQLDQFNSQHPNYNIGGQVPALGMMVYKDLSGPNGKPDGIIDSYDRVLLAKSNFPVVAGLNLRADWKGFSVEMTFSGNLLYKKSFSDLAGGVEWNRMWSQWYNNSWTPTNPNAWLPKRISCNSSNTYQYNSAFWLKNASFMRLRDLSFGYTLPKKWVDNLGVKLFFTGTNLFNITDFNYYDPEISTGTDYPIMRTFNFGIDLTI
jgi:TonB-linked SusC/RagA family outer membrane protein